MTGKLKAVGPQDSLTLPSACWPRNFTVWQPNKYSAAVFRGLDSQGPNSLQLSPARIMHTSCCKTVQSNRPAPLCIYQTSVNGSPHARTHARTQSREVMVKTRQMLQLTLNVQRQQERPQPHT